MADSTPEEQFSFLSQQLLLLNQLPQQDAALAPLEVTPSRRRTPCEEQQVQSAAFICSSGDKVSQGHTSLDGSGPLVDLASAASQAHSPVKPELQDATNVKSHRLQQMQMALREHQSQLLRQREHLQQQQRLLFQRSQERSVAPHSLAQLFADLHDARQQQYVQAQQRTDQTTPAHTSDGRVLRAGVRHHCSKLPSNGAGLQLPTPHCAVDGVGGLAAKREGHHQEQTQETDRDLEPFQLGEARTQQQKRGLPGQCSADRKRILRDAGLLEARVVLSCTLSALRFFRRNAAVAESHDKIDNSSSAMCTFRTIQAASEGGRLSECPVFSREGEPSPSTTAPGGAINVPHGTMGGKVIQVHGEPLPLTVLCAGISPAKLWLHCLRVTLHARRCAIRTRRYWKALVHLFPRRSAYSTISVLSHEDLKRYNTIGSRAPSLRDATTALGPWVAPKEPFCEPGLYCIVDERGPILAAWAVAQDSDGRLRRCSAVVGSGEFNAADEACIKRKRSKCTTNPSTSYSPDSPWETFLKGRECVEADGLQALEKWYVNVTNAPLTEQQIRSLTLGKWLATAKCHLLLSFMPRLMRIKTFVA